MDYDDIFASVTSHIHLWLFEYEPAGEQKAALELIRYQTYRGNEGITGIYAFIRYITLFPSDCRLNNYFISTLVEKDLENASDLSITPRTLNYLKYLNA
jgi:hypothetical protein